MALFQVNIDPVTAEALLVGAIGVFAFLIGVIALMEAVLQARGGPTRAEQEILPISSESLSMTVKARARMSEPLILCFTLSDPAIKLFRVEIANQLDRGTVAVPCVDAAPKTFLAQLDPQLVQRWYNANPYWNGEEKQLPIQIFFISSVQGLAECRTIWVTMCPRKIQNSAFGSAGDFDWFLEGPVLKRLPTLMELPRRAS